MLIKAENVPSSTDGDLTGIKNQEDKLQERLKENEEGKDGQKEIQHFNTQKTEAKLSKTSSPLEITEVTPHLLLCGAVAIRGNVLEELGVKSVINATCELPDTPLPSSLQNDILYLRVDVADKTESQIFPWMHLVSDIVHQVKLAGGKTLIHCVAGISRSATLCLAYLIKYENFTLYESYHKLKGLRPIIRPNSGFFAQLIDFEKQVTGKQTVNMVFSDFTHSRIPNLYEEDFIKFYSSKYRRAQP